MTAQQFIYQAFRKIGQIRPGYTAAPELLADALTEWAAFFDECGAEKNTQYSNPVYQHTITGPGSQTGGNGYTVGPSGADWIQPRPEIIIHANIVLAGGPQPVYIGMVPITQEQWANLAVQQIPGSGIANVFWYDPQYPNGVFNVFPPLTQNAVQIYQSGVLAAPATLGATFAMPPGYWDFVVFGLAERLYHMVPKGAMVARQVPYAVLAAKAKIAKERIKNINRPLEVLRNDFKSGKRPDGYYDSYVHQIGEPY